MFRLQQFLEILSGFFLHDGLTGPNICTYEEDGQTRRGKIFLEHT